MKFILEIKIKENKLPLPPSSGIFPSVPPQWQTGQHFPGAGCSMQCFGQIMHFSVEYESENELPVLSEEMRK